ncbi:MAG: hypothetical protein WCO86_17825 [Planctomycetota bacterium]
MIRLSLLLCLILNVSCSPVLGGDNENQWNCAVYAAFAASFESAGGAKAPSVESIAQCFPENFRGPRINVPISVLVSALECAGLRPKAVRYSAADPEVLSVPAVLLIYPSGKSQKVRSGHYVYLRQTTAIDVSLIDSDSLGAEFHVPVLQLAEIWDGHAIIFERSVFDLSNMPWAVWGLPLLAALATAYRCGRRFRTVSRRRVLTEGR